MQFKLTTLLAALLTATISVAQVPSNVPTTGLVGWWPFNGNANDESGNGNNGTVNGASLTSDRNGNFNKAYEFNGLNNNIVIPNSTSLNFSSFTISCWYNSNSFESSVLVKNNESNCTEYSFGISHQASWNNLGPGLYTSHGTLNNCNSTNRFEHYGANNVVSNNQWVNVIFSINQNGLCQTFLNGNLIDSYVADLFYSCNSSNSTFRIGGPAWGSWMWFDGKIDDVGIWNRVLSQQEITDLSNGCQFSLAIQPVNQLVNISNNAQFVTGSSALNATYQWQTDLGLGFQNVSNAGQYSGANSDTLVVSNVSVTNNNQQFRCIVNPGSCMDTSDIAVLTVNNNVGIIETSPDNLLSIFPNPTKDNFSISGLDKLDNVTSMVLKDLNGKTIKVLDPKATQFKISELKPGVYFLTITAVNKQQVIKLIKE